MIQHTERYDDGFHFYSHLFFSFSFIERESRSAMSLHQGNIENKFHTYNCFKAGLLRQQQKQLDISLKCMRKRVWKRSFLQRRAATMPAKRKFVLAGLHWNFCRAWFGREDMFVLICNGLLGWSTCLQRGSKNWKRHR